MPDKQNSSHSNEYLQSKAIREERQSLEDEFYGKLKAKFTGQLFPPTDKELRTQAHQCAKHAITHKYAKQLAPA